MRLNIIFCLFFYTAFIQTASAQSRTKINFGSGWEFTSSQDPTVVWEKVTIPHTPRIEKLVVVNQYQGISYYRKKFIINLTSNQKAFLYFEGVMMEAEVWINDHLVAHHFGGYLPFTADITPFVQNGKENTVWLKVTNTDNPTIPPGKPLKDLDFNYYGGIYRNVYLIQTHQIYITDAVNANQKASGGLLIHFDSIQTHQAKGIVQVHVKNESSSASSVQFVANLLFKGKQIAQYHSDWTTIPAGSAATLSKKILVPHPICWSSQSPSLYTLKMTVRNNKQVVDELSTQIGIRKSELNANGFFINDQKVFLSGTNRHQEYPYVGYALSDEAQYRDAVKIKNAGFDFVRLSHYPQAEAFLNACDELGLYVMPSIPGWQFFGNDSFEENALQNLKDMIRRDRNHPCILFWENSLNETNMTDTFIQKAHQILKEELPYSNTIGAGWVDHPGYDLFIPARQHSKAPEYWNQYKNGNKKILIAEYGDWEYYAQNAGFNQKEFANLKEEERTSRQLRAFGEKRLLQQAFNFQEASNSNRKGTNTIGEANWLMFDYNRGYSPDIESSGIADIFRIPKWAYYFYQSQRPLQQMSNKKLSSGPMICIANEWTSHSPLSVTVFSNCEEVALYVNNVLIEKKKPSINEYNDRLIHPPFVFSMNQFIPGTLRAEGFVKGKKIIESTIQTPRQANKIELSYDLSGINIHPNYPDLVFVYATITDQNGTIVTDAVNDIEFSLTGDNATLIGQNPIQAEAGISTIILKTTDFKKGLVIKASSPHLQSASIQINPQ